ncbi:MAG: hypothetical protein ABI823_10785 [Bryobacteraceae bacterium]
MQRLSQFGMAALAILLIVAVAQCAVVCQLSPVSVQKAETNVPPCHKQSKGSQAPDNCSHPQDALMAGATTHLDLDWTLAIVSFETVAPIIPVGQSLTYLLADTSSPKAAPPLCLRV